jgi:crossover junction endodeoxyribonuclease RuvC
VQKRGECPGLGAGPEIRKENGLRVLGVDPGTIRCGWGIVDCSGPRLSHVASGVLDAGRGELGGRLLVVARGLADLMEAHRPEAVSLERNFVARNVQSAFRLGEARGVAMAAAAAAGLPIHEYTPMMVKKAVVGYGRAEKAQVQLAVHRLLGLDAVPEADAADALAAALCHGLSGTFQGRLADAVSLRGITRGRGRSWRSVRG